MTAVVAAAGLAEAAWLGALVVGWGWLIVAGVMGLIAGRFKTMWVAVGLIVLLAGFAWVYRPWLAPFEPTDDPDVPFWDMHFRVLFLAWAGCAVVALVALPVMVVARHRARFR